jgi:hypothetical protein
MIDRHGLRLTLIPYNDDAMPLRLTVPFFVGTLPGPLSRQRNNRILTVRRFDGLVLRSFGFPVMLRFCDAQSARSSHPLYI